jgi:hypothetical protein
MDKRPRSPPTHRYTSTRCYLTNSYIAKSVHLLLEQTSYMHYDIWLRDLKNYRTSIKEIVYYVSDKAICRFHTALKQTLNKESPMMRITATSDPEPQMKCSLKTNNTTLCMNTDIDVPGSTNSAVIIIWHIQVAQDLRDICGFRRRTQGHRRCRSAVGCTSRQFS